MRVIPRNTHVSTQHQHDPFWSRVIILDLIIYTIQCEWNYFSSLALFQNKCIPLLFWWRVWMRLMTDMILLMCKWQKSMHLSFDFFTSQCTHPSGSCIVKMKKIAECVHWFLSFALQNHIQSLTSKNVRMNIRIWNRPHKAISCTHRIHPQFSYNDVMYCWGDLLIRIVTTWLLELYMCDALWEYL